MRAIRPALLAMLLVLVCPSDRLRSEPPASPILRPADNTRGKAKATMLRKLLDSNQPPDLSRVFVRFAGVKNRVRVDQRYKIVIVEPRPNVDYKIRVFRPDPNVDYKIRNLYPGAGGTTRRETRRGSGR